MEAKRPTAGDTRLINGELDLFLACGAVLNSICTNGFGRLDSPQVRLLKSLLSRRCAAVRQFAAGVRLPSPDTLKKDGEDIESAMAKVALSILKNFKGENSGLMRDLGLENPHPLLTAILSVLAGGLMFGSGRSCSRFNEFPPLLAFLDSCPSRWAQLMESIHANCRSKDPLLKFERSSRPSPDSFCQEIQLTATARAALRLPSFAEEPMVVEAGRSPARIIELVKPKTRLEQVAVSESLAAELGFLAASCGLPGGTPPVALFHGPPGTGKTFAAEAVAGQIGRPLAVVQIPKILSRYVGVQEQNLECAFEEAAAAKAVLLLDEADAFLMSRQFAQHSHEVTTVNSLLSLLDPPRCPVILCTNYLSHLDEAVHRRIHHMVSFPIPEVAERRRLWELLLKAEGLGEGFACDLLAEVVLTGGLIHNAITRACRKRALLGDQYNITGAVLLGLAFQEAQKMPASKSRKSIGFGTNPSGFGGDGASLPPPNSDTGILNRTGDPGRE